MEFAFSFLVRLFHPLQHAGSSRRTLKQDSRRGAIGSQLKPIGAELSVCRFELCWCRRRKIGFNGRPQSSGEPESRGIMSRKRASMMTKSSHRWRMYRRAASSDSAATHCTSGGSFWCGIPDRPVKLQSCASHMPVVPGRNRLFFADLLPGVFIRHGLACGRGAISGNVGFLHGVTRGTGRPV
jgi:hypothetical protein